jgi:glutamyl-tRNA reductase
MLMCRYIDHYSCDKKDLGIFYSELPEFRGIFNVLSTCHRIEVINITDGDSFMPNFEIGKYKSKRICGNIEVAIRLANIASGIESVILGEPFVFDQVKNAFRYPNHPLIQKISEESLEIAKDVRNEFDFYSRLDYSDIAIKLLGDYEDVVIIGSGMLAKAISKKVEGNVTVVSRSKRAPFDNVVKINDLPNKPFKCMIATSNNNKYKRSVNKYLNESQCSMVVDLSAIPFLSDAKFKYITMYDKVFEDEIELTNLNLISKVSQVENTIRRKVIR